MNLANSATKIHNIDLDEDDVEEQVDGHVEDEEAESGVWHEPS